MSNHSKALALINQLVEKFGKGGYIFRGTTERYSEQEDKDGINSTLYRWAMKVGGNEKIPEQQILYREAFTKNPHFSIAQMEREIAGKAVSLFPSNTKPHEILTELQHFGGKTNMIDFTRSIYIALFFACQGKFDKPGELIALHKDELKEIYEINYAQRSEALEVIAPAGAQSSRQRVHFQSSVFVRPANGYIEPKRCDIVEIPADIKEPVCEYLRIFHNLTDSTIYNDLHGFIKNEKNNESALLYFYIGLASLNKNDDKNAIKYYDKCIELSPNLPEAHNNRATAYEHLKQYNLAIRDYSKAISLNPNDAEYYFNRGITYNNMGEYGIALKDHDKTISLNPNNALAYNNRGYAYYKLGDFERAIEDLSKAISINPNLIKAFENRRMAKQAMGDKKGADADFAEARRLSLLSSPDQK